MASQSAYQESVKAIPPLRLEAAGTCTTLAKAQESNQHIVGVVTPNQAINELICGNDLTQSDTSYDLRSTHALSTNSFLAFLCFSCSSAQIGTSSKSLEEREREDDLSLEQNQWSWQQDTGKTTSSRLLGSTSYVGHELSLFPFTLLFIHAMYMLFTIFYHSSSIFIPKSFICGFVILAFSIHKFHFFHFF